MMVTLRTVADRDEWQDHNEESLDDKNQHPRRLFAAMKLEDHSVDFQWDCGSSCNVLGKSDLSPKAQLQRTSKE